MAQQRILVTGGAGFIGSHLVDRLLASGDASVTVVDEFNDFYDPALKRANVAPHLERDDFRLVEADVANREAMSRLFAEARPDAIVHLAARAGVRPSLAEPMLYQRANVEATYLLLDLAREHEVERFVFGSSSSVYGARSEVPFRETDPINQPASPYAATKLAGEGICHAYAHLYGMRIAALRFFTVYGPRQRPDLAIRKFAERMLDGRSIPLFGDGTTSRDYTYVSDIVDGVLAALSYDATSFEAINLGNERPIALRELVAKIADALGVEPEIEWLPMQPGDVPLTCASVEKAGALLGYSPKVPFEEGLARFADWLREERER